MTQSQSLSSEHHPGISPGPIYLMVFFSGFAGLVYQVLWMRQLGFLFGSTSHAAATTLAAFFAGLAGGSWFWGRRSTTTDNPLQVYAWLEAGIALTALLYFVVLSLFHLIYPVVYQSVASGPLLLAIKFVLALVLIFPSSFCMGGTIPVIGQFLIRSKAQFGITAARIYGVNTLGAALGAFITGFYSVFLLGLKVTCAGAIAISGIVAMTAYCLSRRSTPSAAEDEKEPPAERGQSKEKRKKKRREKEAGRSSGAGDRVAILLVCFLSGFGVLALEVLWTRMFAQVHENSIYSFSSVLVIVLLSLALGALIASWLARLAFPPMLLLAGLTILSGLAVTASPFMFIHLTDELQMLETSGSFRSYILQLFLNGSVFIGLPALVLGTVFPFLMKTEERFAVQPGRSLGRLSAVNTVGAILGSVLCGFVLLGHLGMWRSIQLMAAMYLVAGILLPVTWNKRIVLIKAVGGVFLILLFTRFSPADLPVIGLDPARPEEKVLQAWETSDCAVVAVENVFGDRAIRINSNYRLGSTDAAPLQVFQGRMPLLIFPETKSVFFLGMGTGISAGASLDAQFRSIERVVACEMVPEVVTAAKKYMAGEKSGQGSARFPDFTQGLFKDPRVEILVEDGRHYLMATSDTFDMINADLFLPYRSGAGSLYSREHFESAKARLNPGGVFIQWLPLYQMTENEFGIVARTLLSIFEQVTLWRHNFQPGGEIVAMVGHRDASPLPATTIDSGSEKIAAVAGRSFLDIRHLMLPLNEQTIPLFYCGNLTASKELFAKYPLNTDDRPLIEYMTPRSLRQKTGDLPPTFIGPRLARLVDDIQKHTPPEIDPILAKRTPENRRLPVAGAAFHHAWIEQTMGDSKRCREAWDRFVREWTNQN
ncbi:MAG: fused MFS/spermidine synthase [Planctomycetota bacterium]|jgi:spermidine synthase|nr:fused MFS/spermidine synthase [Planctomycetota bacterium]